MIEIAKVVSVNKNMAKVQIINEKNCGTGCASCKGCSVVTPTQVKVDNKIGASIGQFVKIERNSSAYLKSMKLVFIFPLVMLLIGISLGYVLTDVLVFSVSKDLLGVTLGIIFFIASFFITKLVDKKFKLASNVEFKVIDIVKNK